MRRKKVLSAVGVLCIAALSVTACSSSKSSSGSSAGKTTGNTTSGSTSGQVPDPNATLTFGGANGSDPLTNPHTYAGGLTGWDMYTSSYDRLIQLSSNSLGFEPMLATSWKFNSTSTELTMQLRNDVKFQDGETFNADNAVANLEAAAAKGSNGAVPLADMTSVVATGPYTIKLTFSAPDPDVILALSSYPGMMVSPSGLANPSTLSAHPSGSGPFELVSVSAALTFSFDRFDGYWNKSHVYPAHYVETSIANENTRFNQLLTGGSDFTVTSGLTYQQGLADKSLQTVVYPNLGSYAIYMNNKDAPLNNPDVREAFSLALNRDAINASLEGLCTPGAQAFPAGIDGYNKSLSVPAQDITKAKQLIQQAGATGAKLKMLTINFQPYPTLAGDIQAQLDAIGLDVQVITEPPGATFRTLYQNSSDPLLLANLSMTDPDPSAILDLYVTGVGNPGTKDPALASMIKNAEAMPLGSSGRTSAMQDINKYLTDSSHSLWVTVCQGKDIFVGHKNVIGLNAIPNAALSEAATNMYIQIAK